MSYPYDSGSNRNIAMVIAGIVVGALAVGLVWAVQSRLWSGDGTTAEQSAAIPHDLVTEEPTTTPAASEPTPRLDRCVEVYEAQSGSLEAAATSLAQWEVHIGAMNKLVTGAISLKQATQFWNQTRVGAAHRLEQYADARHEFARRTARCPEPAASETSPELRTCAGAVAARNRAVRLATVALDTWQMHVHHMEMLRDGEMSAEEATQLWLRSWRQGDREVKAYRAAARAADGRTC